MNLSLKLKFKREELIGIIKKNRSKHAKQFNTNVKLYRDKQRDWLKAQLSALDKENPTIERAMPFPAPSHYIKNYDHAISMLTHCKDEEVDLDQVTFLRLVEDDWEGQGINQYPLALNSPLDRYGVTGAMGAVGPCGSSGYSDEYGETIQMLQE